MAILPGDDVGMAPGHDVKHLLLRGHARHGERDAGVDVADHAIHPVAFDQLPRLLDADADVVRGVFDQKIDLAAENAALFVELVDRESRALDLAARDRGIDAGQRIDHSELDRRLAARAQDEGRRDLQRSGGSAGLENRAARDRACGCNFRQEFLPGAGFGSTMRGGALFGAAKVRPPA